MKFVKMIMIVAVAAGVLSLGACAQKKETAAPAPAPPDTRNSSSPAVRLRPDNFNPRGQVVCAAWPFSGFLPCTAASCSPCLSKEPSLALPKRAGGILGLFS